ncbi:hypothetical protein OG21DRAFT_1492086 [Imleria badia]|nr:hypothetical protein OG21DRAFT_1492086 [Imleria badia]
MDDPVSQLENEDVLGSWSDNPAEPSDDEDVVMSDEETWNRDLEGKRTKWLEIVNKYNEHCKIWLRSVLAISDSLLGQGTTVWEGKVESTHSLVDKVVVVKDSWNDPLRKYTEGMILHILEQHGIEGVPMLVSEQQVKTLIRDPKHPHTTVNHSTHFLFSALPRDSSFQLQVLSRLVSQPVGQLILEFSSIGELLVAFLDHIITHKNALEVAGILHRDSLCQRIRNLKWRGVLGDWGYAVPISASSATTPSDTSSVDVPCCDGPPTLPIEADVPDPSIQYDNRVPARKIDSHDAPTLVPVTHLTANDDIVLLMGTNNPDDDSRKTIDLCPLYRTVSSTIFIKFTKLTSEVNLGNMVVDVVGAARNGWSWTTSGT